MQVFDNAKWIAKNSEYPGDGSFLSRKTFHVSNKFESAVMYVCGLGYGKYFINGMNVTDDVLTTPFTKFDATLLYNTYDVSHLLSAGDNSIGVMIGNGWYNDTGDCWDFEKASWRHHPKFIMQLRITYFDGSVDNIVSDPSWKAADGPIVYNHVRCGEIYDARLEQPGWNEADFSGTNWEDAFICRSPGGILSAADIPPIRVIKSLKATKISDTVYDLGQNISGWVKITVKGESGDEVVLKYAELLNDDGTINNYNANIYNSEDIKHCDKYILNGNGTQTYEPSFVYHGFRYVDLQSGAEIIEILGQVVHTDLETIGEFECGDDMLNKIHTATRWSTLTNFVGLPTDCPQREQLGWTGDAQMSAEQTLMNYDVVRSYKKWLNDFKDVQRPSGQIPGIVPTSAWGYNRIGPAFDSALISIPYYVYKIAGDKSLVRQMWDNMKLYMDFLRTMSQDYIVDFGLGDWSPPPGAVICPTAVTDTAYYYSDAVIMAKCAELIGEDGSCFRQLAENIRSAFREKFLQDKSLFNCQTFFACCIYQGLYNEDEIPAAVKMLAELVRGKDYHIDCGILGTKYIFSALSENGYADVLYKMIKNPTMPSYAYWINQGMTTLCESWHMTASYHASLNHHMFSEVDMWFYKHLAGIQINGNDLTINPCFLDGLEWVKAKHRDILVEWNSDALKVTTPRSAKIVFGGKEYSVEKGTYEYRRKGIV